MHFAQLEEDLTPLTQVILDLDIMTFKPRFGGTPALLLLETIAQAALWLQLLPTLLLLHAPPEQLWCRTASCNSMPRLCSMLALTMQLAVAHLLSTTPFLQQSPAVALAVACPHTRLAVQPRGRLLSYRR